MSSILPIGVENSIRRSEEPESKLEGLTVGVIFETEAHLHRNGLDRSGSTLAPGRQTIPSKAELEAAKALRGTAEWNE